MLSGNVMDVKFRDTIDDKPKYLNPPEPDGIKVEIEYLKDRMLDTTKIPASRLSNTNHADENETAKPTPKRTLVVDYIYFKYLFHI